MKRILLAAFLALAACASAQAGASTPPPVTVAWTNSTTVGLTGECIYRSTSPASYGTALYCTPTPVGSWKDMTTVWGASYFYAVSEKYGNFESILVVAAPAPIVIPAQPVAAVNVTVGF